MADTSSVAVIELHYLPTIRYWSIFFQYEEVWIEQHENYNKGSFRNRTYIGGPNGPQRLSVPLRKGKNEQMPIKSVQIAHDEAWYRQHWKAIQAAYSNAPFFDYYAEELESIYLQPVTGLFEWNLRLLNYLQDSVPVPAIIRFTQDFKPHYQHPVKDLRNQFSPKPQKTEIVPFSNIPIYPQVFQEKHGFLPNLSTLDLLFCTGPESVRYIEQSLP